MIDKAYYKDWEKRSKEYDKSCGLGDWTPSYTSSTVDCDEEDYTYHGAIPINMNLSMEENQPIRDGHIDMVLYDEMVNAYEEVYGKKKNIIQRFMDWFNDIFN